MSFDTKRVRDVDFKLPEIPEMVKKIKYKKH